MKQMFVIQRRQRRLKTGADLAITLASRRHRRDVALLSEYRNGVAARLWRVAQATCLDGVKAERIATR
jgi:hypothetical protein